MHGGAEKVLVNLVNNLHQEKYDITLFSIFDEGVNKDFLKPHIKYQYQFKKIFRGNSQLMKLFSPKFLYRFMIKEHYDIAIAYLEGPAARIISGCANPKTKKIAWIHTEFTDKQKAKIGFRTLSDAKKSYEKFDNVIAVSKNVAENFQKFITKKNPLKILYNTNETELIKLLSQEPTEIEFDKETLQICSLGKIIDVKGFDRLLEVHKKLIDEGYKHYINILGIGEEKAKLEKRVKELGVEKTFRFLGFHKNPYKLLSKNDLYICSSRREGFSTAVTEALVLGIPVVSTHCSGAKELLGENNEYGIVTENSTEGIYEGLKTMLSDENKLKYYKKQAEWRGSFFSKENTVKAVEEFLDSLKDE